MKKSAALVLSLVVLPLLLPIVGATVFAGEPPWLDGWTYRIPITIDRTRVSGPLADFPVLLHLSASSGENSADISSIFSVLGQNGKRLAVTSSDGTTQLPVEIARWDAPGRQAYLWTKVPSLSNAASTYLYLYYDANQPDNTTFVGDTGSAAAESVWDSSFVGVWHLAQAGHGTAGEYKDSTSNHRDGQGGGGLGYGTPALTTTGAPMGAAQTFNGSNSYISIPDSDAFSVTATGNLTVSAWISPATVDQPSATEDYTRWMGKSTFQNVEWQFVYYNKSHPTRSQFIAYFNYGPNGGFGPGDYSTGNIPANSWVYVTGTSSCSAPNEGVQYIYRNAAEYSGITDMWQNYGFAYANGVAPVTVGTGLVGSGNWWSGGIGEIRISSVVRSQAWIATSYYAERDSLLVYGPFQLNPSPPPSPTPKPSLTSTTTTPPATTTQSPAVTTTKAPVATTTTPVTTRPTSSTTTSHVAAPVSSQSPPSGDAGAQDEAGFGWTWQIYLGLDVAISIVVILALWKLASVLRFPRRLRHS